MSADEEPTIPENRVAIYDEAERLAVRAFDPEFLNPGNVVSVPGQRLAGKLFAFCWN